MTVVRCAPPSAARLKQLPRPLPTLALPRGTLLYRVHDRGEPCDEFVTPGGEADDVHRGGRFDPLPREDVPVLYVASSADAAIAEVFAHVDARGVVRAQAEDRHERALSALRLRRRLVLVAFRGLDLHRFPLRNAQLTESGKQDYPCTRGWAQAFRDRAPHAQGIAWTSRLDNGAYCCVLWGDRVGAKDVEPASRAVALASARGAARVRAVLRRVGLSRAR